MNQKWKQIICSLALLLAAFFWGTTFVAQKSVADEALGAFTFNGIRCLMGSVVLLPLVVFIGKAPLQAGGEPTPFKKQLLYGSICGVLLFLATNLQQFGMSDTTAGKSGFVTALYVVLVPLFGMLFFRYRTGWNTWLAVLMAAVGLYLLCIKQGFTVQKGDAITFFCAVVFAVHILTVDKVSDRIAGVTLSCLQFLVAGILSLICMLILEQPSWQVISASVGPLLYSGILSCGVAYTLQIVGQKYTDPTVASLLMSLESVFAVLAGFLVLHESLTLKETVGCIIMFAAIIFAQLPFGKSKKERVSFEM